MPSWLTPMTSEMFSIARSVVRATREPASARGSIWVRRAETSANSAPTKNALPSSRSTATSRARSGAHGSSLVAGVASCCRLVEQPQADPVDAQAVHPLDGQHGEPLARLVGVGVVGHRHLGEVADARAPGRAPAAPGRRSVS